MSVLQVAVNKPLRTTFDYLPPEGVDIDTLTPGVRVKVPFGAGTTTGYVLAIANESSYPIDKLKQAIAVLDTQSAISPAIHRLMLWAADYYCHPVGEVYGTAFPAILRKGKALTPLGERYWELTEHGLGLPEGALGRAKKQAQLLGILQTEGAVNESSLRERGISPAILRALKDKQLVKFSLQIPASKPWQGAQGLTLNGEQSAALKAMTDAGSNFNVQLLEGVTGAGKTEVYLQLIDHYLQQGRQALVLIPEIGLTPQTLARFTTRFGPERVVAMHSGMTDAQRARHWQLAAQGLVDILIGTRSAVFTPLARPGVIIVDEEHDGAYKQQDGFRYNARDLAVKRGQLENAQVVLGSATPSLESAANAERGRYQRLRLTQRAGSANLPKMSIIDVRRQALQAGLSQAAIDAIAQTLSQHEQVLLFLQRRGFAPSLRCHQCGWIASCFQCDAHLTLHQGANHLRCHHCEARQPVPGTCPDCHSNQLITKGVGTEQAEVFLREQFPGTAIYRIDSDTITTRDALHQLLERINSGGPAILVGTQMLSKGHHFPHVTLALIHDADSSLFSTDFRGEERLAQLITQVAGRAGREAKAGTVLLQTHYPHHPAITEILKQNYHAHSLALLSARKTTNLPPSGQMVLLHSEAPELAQAEQFLLHLKQRLGQLPTNVILIGPLPSPMQRRAGLYRCQLTILGQNRAVTQQITWALIREAEKHKRPSRLRWFVDVDPQELF